MKCREALKEVSSDGFPVTRRSADTLFLGFWTDHRLKDLARMGEWAAAERPAFRKPAVDGFRKLGGVGCREQLVFVYLAHRNPQSLFQAYLKSDFSSSLIPHRTIKVASSTARFRET